MRLVMRKAESCFDGAGQWGAQQSAAVLPAPLVPGERTHTHFGEFVRKPQPMQDARRVGADLDAGANLAQDSRTFVNVYIEAGVQEGKRRSQAAEAAANNCNGIGRLQHDCPPARREDYTLPSA